jgi:hypothetical protein
MSKRKSQLAQQVMALATSPFDDSPIPLNPFVAGVMVPLTGAGIASMADRNYGPEFEEGI